MLLNKFFKIIALTLLCLTGCGDEGLNIGNGNGSDFNLGSGDGNFGGGNSGGGSGGSSLVNLSSTLDCQDLDPDKVYVFGTLSGRVVEAFALADPDKTSSFCVAFPSLGIPLDTEAVISSSGNIIYHNRGDAAFYSMVPDIIFRASNGELRYPLFPSSNDGLVAQDLPVIGTLLEQMVSIPSNNEDEIFYKHDTTRDIYSSLSNEVYYTNPNRHELIGALENGSLILFSRDLGVVILDDELVENVLVPPVSGPFEFTNVPAKRASDGTVWIAVALRSDENTLLRWRLAANNTLINEGKFADLPDGYVINNSSISVFDGLGNLYENTQNESSSAVIRRPLSSSNSSSQIVYSFEFTVENVNRNWKTATDQIVTPYKLFTGS